MANETDRRFVRIGQVDYAVQAEVRAEIERLRTDAPWPVQKHLIILGARHAAFTRVAEIAREQLLELDLDATRGQPCITIWPNVAEKVALAIESLRECHWKTDEMVRRHAFTRAAEIARDKPLDISMGAYNIRGAIATAIEVERDSLNE